MSRFGRLAMRRSTRTSSRSAARKASDALSSGGVGANASPAALRLWRGQQSSPILSLLDDCEATSGWLIEETTSRVKYQDRSERPLPSHLSGRGQSKQHEDHSRPQDGWDQAFA